MKILRLSALLIILGAFTFPPAPTVLEHKFKVGDSYEWTQNTVQNMKQNVPGAGEVVTETKSANSLLIKVLELTKTGAKVELIIPKMKVDTKSAYGNLLIDSEGDESIAFNKVLKAITATTVVAYINKTGAVEKFEGLEKFQTNIAALTLDDATKAGAKSIADQFASESALKSNLEQSLLQYPEAKLKVGDTWKTSNTVPLNIPFRVDNTWKLTALEGGVASLENDGIVVTSDSTKEFSAQGFRAKANMNGRVAAKAKTNLATGMPTEIKGISEIKGSITLLAGNGIPEDMVIPMEIVTETEQVVIKK